MDMAAFGNGKFLAMSNPVKLCFAAGLGLYLALLPLSPLSRASTPTYLVVVNANNPFSAEQQTMMAQIKRLYLKQQHAWPNDDKSIPFRRPVENEAYGAFNTEILRMTERELNSHWLRLKQTSGETQPEAVSSVRSLLRQIARNKGAFSIIRDGEARKLPAKVRVLFSFSTGD